MLTTAKEIGKLDIQALKIHMLYVIKNTKLNQMYQNNQFTMLTRDEYIDLVTEQLSYLPENIVIERLTGDGNVDDLVAPDWSIKIMFKVATLSKNKKPFWAFYFVKLSH